MVAQTVASLEIPSTPNQTARVYRSVIKKSIARVSPKPPGIPVILVTIADNRGITTAKVCVCMRVPTKLNQFDKITPSAVVPPAQAGDTYAREILIKQGENLGIRVRSVVNFINPGAIIVGRSVGRKRISV